MAVGVRTIAVGALAVEVWYPAVDAARNVLSPYDVRDWLTEEGMSKVSPGVLKFNQEAARDADPLPGPFPVLVFSHGLSAYRSQSTFLTTHLASHGWVVLAPDHLGRGLAALLAGQVPDFESAPRELLEVVAFTRGPRDPRLPELDSMKLALAGHSAGSAASAAAAREASAAFWLGMAGNASDPEPTSRAVFMAGSSDDTVLASATRSAFETYTSTRSYYELNGAGHLVFSDICEIAKDRGGLVGVAKDSGVTVNPLLLELGKDGCEPGELPASAAWPPIRHFVTAALTRTFEPTREVVDDEIAAQCFGAVIRDRR